MNINLLYIGGGGGGGGFRGIAYKWEFKKEVYVCGFDNHRVANIFGCRIGVGGQGLENLIPKHWFHNVSIDIINLIALLFEVSLRIEVSSV